jgi:zinc transport system permease protein
MIGYLLAMLSYTFAQRALAAGLLISVCAALLGVSLVLKRYAMIGDGLSHVGFGSLAVAMALNLAPLPVALPATVIAAFLLLRLSEAGKIKGDSAIALISASSVAVGVFVVSMTTGMNTDVDSFLFGSILAIGAEDMAFSVASCLAVIILYVFFYNRFFAVVFDEQYARSTGMRTGAYTTLLAVMVALTIVIGMRMMGALLISSLVIFPALTSMTLFKRFKQVIVFAVCISVLCFIVGFLASFILGTPTGASVVLANLLAFSCCWLSARIARR